MAHQFITLQVPHELVSLLGSADTAAARAKQALVLDLLREVRISQGQAASLLGMTRGRILDLMVQYQIPSGPETPDELRDEIESISQIFDTESRTGSNQQA
jgi:hypothetical protein